jgi:TRAP-type mannitol/chloroaromatic compound transport system substrate-binding protein
MNSINRKDFLKKTVIAAAGGSTLLAGCAKAENSQGAANINLGKTFEWRMVTTWPPHFPILGEGADKIAKMIGTMSGGRLKIQVYGGGELVPALESFDAVSAGTAHMGHSASYYWAGKAPASQLFTSVPFGMNTQQTYAWILYGGGLQLWEELYSPFNLIPLPGGNTGCQMGGWFNKEINSVADLKGLRMRIPGIGGKIITKAGGSAVLSPGGEIYTNLERGVIDATDWVGPFHDWKMGFHKIAKYYYYPTFAEPTGVMEVMINKNAFAELPSDLQAIVKQAVAACNIDMLSEFEAKNAEYLEKIRTETKVMVKSFPDDVVEVFRKYANEALEELATSDAFSKKVLDSYNSFRKSITGWTDIADKNFV